MLKKITTLFKGFILVLFIAAILFIVGGIASSLGVRCDLQENQYYTCQAHDILLGITLSEVTAGQVYGLDYDFDCGGSGTKRSCSDRANFITADGDRIRLSNLYISTDQVPKMVDTLNSLMAKKSTPINMVFPPTTFTSIVTISIISCVLILFTFTTLLFLFGKDAKDLESHAIDLRKKS